MCVGDKYLIGSSLVGVHAIKVSQKHRRHYTIYQEARVEHLTPLYRIDHVLVNVVLGVAEHGKTDKVLIVFKIVLDCNYFQLQLIVSSFILVVLVVLVVLEWVFLVIMVFYYSRLGYLINFRGDVIRDVV